MHAIAKNAYRLRGADEPGGRIRHRKRREIVYAGTAAERWHWLPADKAMIAAQLDRTEKWVVAIINDSSQSDFEELLKRVPRRYQSEEKDGEQRRDDGKD
jgi:hypothetical protein